MCVQVYVCLIYVCVILGEGCSPGVPPDCSLVYSASSACLKGMEMLFFLLNEKDFTGRDAFIHDMHIESYTQAYTQSHSISQFAIGLYRRCNAMLFEDHKDAFSLFFPLRV